MDERSIPGAVEGGQRSGCRSSPSSALADGLRGIGRYSVHDTRIRSSERLIDAISRLTDHVEILGDILERFHVTCEWAVNNDRFRSVSENAP